jgi:hypothetical protein
LREAKAGMERNDGKLLTIFCTDHTHFID